MPLKQLVLESSADVLDDEWRCSVAPSGTDVLVPGTSGRVALLSLCINKQV